MADPSLRAPRWHRPRNVILAILAIAIVAIGWVASELAALMRATPNPAVNYAAKFRELSEGHVRGEWDAGRAKEAWRLLEEASDRAVEILHEHDARMRRDPQRYPPRFEFDEDIRIGFGYAGTGRDLPADIEREREVLAALKDEGVFDLLDRFAELAPGFTSPEIGDLAAVMQNIPPVGHRDLARALTAAMRIAAVEGDEQEMLRCFDRSLAIAQTLSHQPALVWHLVGAAVNRMAVDEMRMLLSEHSFEPVTYLAALSIMDRRALPPMELVLEGERLLMMDMVQFAYSDDGAGNGYFVDYAVLDPFGQGAAGQGGSMGLLEAFGSRFVFPSRHAFVEAMNGYFDIARDELTRAPAQWLQEQPTRVTAYIEGLSVRHFLLKTLAPALEKAIMTDRVVRMFYEATRVVAAVELHRAEQGHYPASLDDLVVDDLVVPLIDPIHGGPFGYRLLKDDPLGRQFLLYSFGLDASDDGGREYLGSSVLPDPDARWKPLRRLRYAAGHDFIINWPREEWTDD